MNTDAASDGLEGRKLHRSETDRPGAEPNNWSDLGPRAASGIVLAASGVTAAWFGGPWLAAACGAAVVIMSYEWARMSEPRALAPAFLFALAGSLGAVMLSSVHLLGIGVVWLAACALCSGARRRSFFAVLETVGGVLYIGLPPALFLWLRDRAPEGLATILVLFAIIWSADIFAYLGGKLIGGPKIAEGLSPHKTWSGIVSGVVAGAGAGLACGALFSVAADFRLAWLAIGASIAFTGLMGDLFESFLKRRFGVKDASRVIPGHGGVLDRLDGLMAATLLAGAVLAAAPRAMDALFGSGP